jgi:peptidyl-prolyl cis-trans isomerase A (cyclophilin A)
VIHFPHPPRRLSPVSVLALALLGCSSRAAEPRQPSAADLERDRGEPAAPEPWPLPPTADELVIYLRDVPGTGEALLVEIKTSMGSFHCQLYPTETPLTVANFLGLATGRKPWNRNGDGPTQHGKPLYQGTVFHRTIPGFMIQGGDPLGTGRGGPGYTFVNETSLAVGHVAGALSMANAGPDTNGSQFFITELPRPDLDGAYSAFGRCAETDLVARISALPHDEDDKPIAPVTIDEITFSRGPSLAP